MDRGARIVIAKNGQYPEYLIQVFESTNQLFFLLEAVELLEEKVAAEAKPQYLERAFKPSQLCVGISSSIRNPGVGFKDEISIDGRLVQLAYQGWKAAVDGAWEKYRTNPPYDPTGNLKHGLEADVFGDLHKIRNDVLKHRAKATKNNTGRCKVLKWFMPGEDMRFSLSHVLEFLHHIGCYLRPAFAEDTSLVIQWEIQHRWTWPNTVISNRVNIEAIPKNKGGGFGLFISMMFADGVQGAVLVSHADNPDALRDYADKIRDASLDEFGAPIIPALGRIDVGSTYRSAVATLRDSNLPFDPGSPPIRFG